MTKSEIEKAVQEMRKTKIGWERNKLEEEFFKKIKDNEKNIILAIEALTNKTTDGSFYNMAKRFARKNDFISAWELIFKKIIILSKKAKSLYWYRSFVSDTLNSAIVNNSIAETVIEAIIKSKRIDMLELFVLNRFDKKDIKLQQTLLKFTNEIGTNMKYVCQAIRTWDFVEQAIDISDSLNNKTAILFQIFTHAKTTGYLESIGFNSEALNRILQKWEWFFDDNLSNIGAFARSGLLNWIVKYGNKKTVEILIDKLHEIPDYDWKKNFLRYLANKMHGQENRELFGNAIFEIYQDPEYMPTHIKETFLF